MQSTAEEFSCTRRRRKRMARQLPSATSGASCQSAFDSWDLVHAPARKKNNAAYGLQHGKKNRNCTRLPPGSSSCHCPRRRRNLLNLDIAGQPLALSAFRLLLEIEGDRASGGTSVDHGVKA